MNIRTAERITTMSLTTKILRGLAVLGMAGAALIGTTALPGAAPAADAAPYYKLVGLGSNKCVDIRAEDAAAGARAQLWQCYGSPNQRFTLLKVGTTSTGRPYFQIVNQKAPYMCLEVRGSSFSNGARVQQWDCNATSAQMWKTVE